jgi:hypothetical protein
MTIAGYISPGLRLPLRSRCVTRERRYGHGSLSRAGNGPLRYAISAAGARYRSASCKHMCSGPR